MRLFGGVAFLAGAVEAQDVEAYIGRVFVHGVPYADSLQWSSELDLTSLIAMLDGTPHPRWINVVAVLGIVGDDRAFCPLVESLSRHAFTPGVEEAALAVPLALGYLVHSRRGTGVSLPERAAAALAILQQGVDPGFWGSVWPAALTPGCELWRPLSDDSGRAQYVRRTLARRSVLGLVLSGHASGVATLESLAVDLQAEGDLGALFSDLLPDLLESAREIEKDGLAKYYGE